MTKPLAQLNEEQFRANRFDLVSRLADDLAHEIKNPLNAIVINLEVLKVRAARGDTTAAIERVAVIEHEVRRLHHLMDRLLQLLRPESPDADSLALDQVLDEVLPLVEAQARLARNELSIEGLAPVPVPMRRDFLKFAVLNVLTAVHGRLGEGGGVLRLVCETGPQQVRLVITAVAGNGARLRPADRAFAAACSMASTLLDAAGGSLETVRCGVVLILPRRGKVA
ncbi:MAG TPA: histidine kinase dimerization/phospho-acceptor domain-containing protein [Longimicrobiales bacterium]|nr:histidine kinase dimerization/phospho-acceptor domain-containing protein [Longimicrobiales bacterium]